VLLILCSKLFCCTGLADALYQHHVAIRGAMSLGHCARGQDTCSPQTILLPSRRFCHARETKPCLSSNQSNARMASCGAVSREPVLALN